MNGDILSEVTQTFAVQLSTVSDAAADENNNSFVQLAAAAVTKETPALAAAATSATTKEPETKITKSKPKSKPKPKPKPEKKVKCEHCPKSFAYHSEYQLHLPVHVKELRHQCKQCEKSFSRLSTLKEHIKECHCGGASPSNHRCDQCLKSYRRARNLAKHQRLFHHHQQQSDNGNCNQCPHCLSTFAQASYLKVHLQKMHPNEESTTSEGLPLLPPKIVPLNCPACYQRFNGEQRLKEHLQNGHKNIRPTACPLCPEQDVSAVYFIFIDDLQSHLEEAHRKQAANNVFSLIVDAIAKGTAKFLLLKKVKREKEKEKGLVQGNSSFSKKAMVTSARQ